ncbi:MAG: histidine phosphatase family protein [Saprospiraceae bacterium]|nr:histidine phosphatase family protein [Saprospiraceae bacterium]
MKTLFLVRHAKSSWAILGQRDHERSLELRGHNDAPRMAKYLKQLGIKPDLIVSSPAVRARTTAEYFAKEFGIDPQHIDIQQDVYEADERDIANVIRSLPDESYTVLLFGHNPTFTYVADSYSKEVRFENLPTCGIVQIEQNTEGGTWDKFNPKTAEVKGFWFPKTI